MIGEPEVIQEYYNLGSEDMDESLRLIDDHFVLFVLIW